MKRIWRYWFVLSLPFFVVGCAGLAFISDALPPVEESSSTKQAVQPISEVSRIEMTATPTSGMRDDTHIVFVSDRGASGTTDIYQINVDGSGLIKLTRDLASDQDPVISPDQKQIAFTSDRTGINQIFLMSMEDFEVQQLTNHPEGGMSPTWSPDGTKLAFVESNADRNAILIMSNLKEGRIDSLLLDVMSPANLAWSPLGDKIAFSALIDDNNSDERAIFTYDLNTDLLINLTNKTGNHDYPSWSPDGLKIAFQTNRDGDENIYVMSANGALQTPLTTNPKADVEPGWSSDGRLILFSSDRDGQFNIYAMNDSGGDQIVLASFPSNDRQPHWPPSTIRPGDELVYASGIFTEVRDLILTNATGTTRSQITENDSSDDTMPDWSPDGTQIVFSSSQSGNYDIYKMKADGSNWVKLTVNPGDDKHPSWSPDGRTIAFESIQGDDDWDVWIMDADGNNLKNITAEENSNDGNPSWSPDGKEIAFSSNRQGSYDIYVMSADGSGSSKRLTGSETDDFHPDWSPGGELIAYRSTSPISGKRDIKVVTVDGHSSRNLFSSQANDDTPAWSPDGQRISFASDRLANDALNSDGVYRIYMYDLETGIITQTSRGNRDGQYPAWRPN